MLYSSHVDSRAQEFARFSMMDFPNGALGLWVSSYFDLTEIVDLLLERGADVATEGSCGWEVLYRAAYNGHEAVVRLLEKGAVSREEEALERRRCTRRPATDARQRCGY
jgi:hypothetical protein